MGPSVGDTIQCDSCGKRFARKPQLAGKRVRCPCGALITVPAESDRPDDLYDLFEAEGVDAPPMVRARPAVRLGPGPGQAAISPDDAPVDPNSPQAIAARLGIALPPAPSKVKDAAAAVGEGRAELERLAAGSTLRDVIVPIPIIVAGLVLSFVQASYWDEHPAAGAGEALGVVAGRAALAVGLMLVAMFLLTRCMDVNFMGRFSRCVLRLCAIALGPAAVYPSLVFLVGGDLGGPCAGVAASLVLYGVLFWGLMRLDLKDTTVCVVVTWILVTFANYAAWRAEGLIRGNDI